MKKIVLSLTVIGMLSVMSCDKKADQKVVTETEAAAEVLEKNADTLAKEMDTMVENTNESIKENAKAIDENLKSESKKAEKN